MKSLHNYVAIGYIGIIKLEFVRSVQSTDTTVLKLHFVFYTKIDYNFNPMFQSLSWNLMKYVIME